MHQCLLLTRLDRFDFSVEPARLKNRLRQAESQLPDQRGAGQQITQRAALAAEITRQRKARKHRRARHRDARIRGDQALLGLHDIRAAQQQIRRQSLGGHQRRRFISIRVTLDGQFNNRTRTASEQHRQRQLFRRATAFQRGQLRLRRRQFGFELP